MSNPLLKDLPRFDDDAVKPVPASPDFSAGQDIKSLRAKAAEQVALAAAAAQEADAETRRKVAEANQAALDTLTEAATAMNTAIARLEAQADAHITANTLAIAARLFPKLADMYLAEEIERLLADLVPPSKTHITIHAAPDIIAQLEERICDTPTLAERCEIIAAPDRTGRKVDVAWGDGGVTIDFDACLADSLRRAPSHTDTQEQISHGNS